MQKIYVLLRHDKQTGPYSLPELIQFDLKPYDLIWIEGQSAGWYYPQEIAALHPYLGFLPKKPALVQQAPPPEKKVAVQMPVTNETPPAVPLPEIATPASADTYQYFSPVSKNLEEAVHAQFRTPVAEKEPPVVAASSPAKKNSPNPVVVGITTVLIVGGVFAASWIMNRQPNEEQTATGPFVETPVPNEIKPPAVAPDDNTKNKRVIAAARPKQPKNSVAFVQTSAGRKTNAKQTKEETGVENIVDDATADKTTLPPKTEETPGQSGTTSVPSETNAPQENKKTLREKFLDLFKKKPEEKKSDERRPTENENGERVATRRESSLLQSVHVRFDVPNDWMMGIKNAKATLVNRSHEKIKGATMEVLYYNDDNELLQTKVVTFGKIDVKESQTIPIPDHSTATKVDYKVLSVTGANQPAA